MQGLSLPLSEPLLPFCGHRTPGGSEEAASLAKVPSCVHWGGNWGCRTTRRGRGDRDGRNYSGHFSSRTHAPQGSDSKRLSCLPGKDVSCTVRLNPPSATASPSQKPPLLGRRGAKPHTPHLACTALHNHPSFLLSPALVSCCPNKSQNTQTSQD